MTSKTFSNISNRSTSSNTRTNVKKKKKYLI